MTSPELGDVRAALPAGARSRLAGLDPRSLTLLHVYTDVILVAAAWLGAWGVRALLDDVVGRPINPFETYVRALPLIVPPWIVSCWLFGIYRRTRTETAVDRTQRLLRSGVLGLGVLATTAFFAKEYDLGRLVVLFSAGLSVALQGVSRLVFGRLEQGLRASGRHEVPVLIVGAGTTGVRLLQRIEDHPEIGYRVIGFLDDAPRLAGQRVAGRPVLGRLEALRQSVAAQGVEVVVVAIPELPPARLLGLVLECEDLEVRFRMVTGLFDVLTRQTRVRLLDDLPLVSLEQGRASLFYAPLKRTLDLLGAGLLLVLTAPLWLWCALRIQRDSPGPALFAHERVGKDGRRFRLYKFRTMRCNADPAAPAPLSPEDTRITAYGRWLRRTSIDELPQLLNVLRGEMSLVGPRPEMPFIVEGYEAWQRRRLRVPPGITGLWQILGRKDLPMHENLQYDFWYIHNRSLLLDVSILIRTLSAVLSRRGAF